MLTDTFIKMQIDELLVEGMKSGSNIKLIGPPMTGKEVILKHMMYHWAVKNDYAVITVNTHEPGTRILEWFRENRLTIPQSRIGIVDCISNITGVETEGYENIKTVENPVDLAGIGVRIIQFYEKFFNIENIQKIQLSINSVSTLLMYSDVKTVFRFLHVFTERIKKAGGLGIYVMESGIHDMRDISTLNQLFDGVIEIKTENDTNFIRTTGILTEPTPWFEYEIDGADVRILKEVS